MCHPKRNPDLSALFSRPARHIALALLAVAVACAAGSVRTGFDGRDEYRYAHIAREMSSLERLFVLHNQGQLYLDKPPLYFWMARGAYALTGGVSAFGARLPLILSTVLTAFLVYGIGRRLLTQRAALLAALAFGLAFRPIWSAHNTKLDPPLVLFIVLALWFWVRGGGLDESRRRPAWPDVAGMWLAMALGFLVKGPLGLLPLGIVGVWRIVRRDWRGMVGWSTLLGIGVFVLTLAVWVVPAWQLGGWDHYLGPMMGQEIVDRVVKPPQHVKEGLVNVFYYFVYIWGDFFPAAFFLPGALWLGWRRRHAGGARTRLFLFTWFTFIMVLFTLATSKRSQYILPAYPAAALLVGWFLDRVLDGDTRDRARWHLVPLGIVATFSILGAASIWLYVTPLLKEFHEDLSVAGRLLASLAMLVCAALCIWGIKGGRLRAGLVGCFGMVPAVLVVAYTLYFPRACVDEPYQRFSERMDGLVKPGGVVLTPKRRQPQLSIWGHYVTFGMKEPGGKRLLGFAPNESVSRADLLEAFSRDSRPMLLVVSGDDLEEFAEEYPGVRLHEVWTGDLPIYSDDGGFRVVSNVPDYAKVTGATEKGKSD